MDSASQTELQPGTGSSVSQSFGASLAVNYGNLSCGACFNILIYSPVSGNL